MSVSGTTAFINSTIDIKASPEYTTLTFKTDKTIVVGNSINTKPANGYVIRLYY